ncbi:DUF397 domain-containing protein [Streptomyces turgidiscabies]|uniref:DUF397 domain-containing protein n=1 Tax=Streptomyces turgidiscabies TaxID=85558 RepID=A0ABU0RQC4_9ACTN|nr:DUF397 domain-containing protein [Streptomyces turgidiscabies]MDQ0934182.1 hypothetical protein [Streptomyces turgidiscabies]
MGTSQDLSAARWHKSSYSSDTGGDCVECAPLGTAAWRKSSYSGDTGGQCVEIAPPHPPHPPLRRPRLQGPDLGALTLTPEAFAAFVSWSG